MSRMHKKYKIRRYGQLYPSRRSTSSVVLHTVLTVTIVFVLGFVGWNAYGPVRDYFSGALAASAHRQETPSAPPDLEKQPPEEEELPPKPEEPPAELRAVYLPGAMLADRPTLETFLERMADSDLNAVMFDLKDASGTVLYQSRLDTVAQAGAQSETAFDLYEVCRALSEHGLTPIGRLSVFADPKASARLDDAGIKYMNTNMLWLDNSLENGGKGWLNPYSEAARAYLTSLITEAASMGVKRIVLDQYSFPTGVGLEFANYGPNAESIQPAIVLAANITAFEHAANENGASLSLYVSGPAALGTQNHYYGEQNPLTLYSNVTVGLMPAQFGDGYTDEEFVLEAPILTPYETVQKLLGQLSPTLSGKEVSAMIQGYTATGSLENNKVYKMEDIEGQLRALNEDDVTSYILYSPGGSYPAD